MHDYLIGTSSVEISYWLLIILASLQLCESIMTIICYILHVSNGKDVVNFTGNPLSVSIIVILWHQPMGVTLIIFTNLGCVTGITYTGFVQW